MAGIIHKIEETLGMGGHKDGEERKGEHKPEHSHGEHKPEHKPEHGHGENKEGFGEKIKDKIHGGDEGEHSKDEKKKKKKDEKKHEHGHEHHGHSSSDSDSD